MAAGRPFAGRPLPVGPPPARQSYLDIDAVDLAETEA